jgi:urease accessory protein
MTQSEDGAPVLAAAAGLKRVTAVMAAGSWAPGAETDRVLIDFDRRYRRRITLPTEAGDEVLIDLPQAVRLRDGDGLALEDGQVIRVVAQAEKLLEIHAHSPAELVRIAWHLGNRHLPVQLLGDRIRIRADHVIADMVHGLGGHAHPVKAPFDPEGGAYAGGHSHSHDD